MRYITDQIMCYITDKIMCYITDKIVCYITDQIMCCITDQIVCYITDHIVCYRSYHALYSYFEKGCQIKCTRQPRKVLWVVLSSLFFKKKLIEWQERPWTYVCEC